MTFLEEVLEVKREEITRLRQSPPAILSAGPRGFGRFLRRKEISIIAEIKRRSPSKGDLARSLDVAETAQAYAAGDAAAISCLTDRRFFGAEAGDFGQALCADLPVLRKDFLIDEIQIDESAAMGAAAILLIVRILPEGRLEELLRYAASRGLEALVEIHDESEIDRALQSGATMIGVNNRDLATLEIDPGRAARLRALIPAGVLTVAESGVKTREDVKRIEDAGFDATLIGEALITNPDPAAMLMQLAGKTMAVLR